MNFRKYYGMEMCENHLDALLTDYDYRATTDAWKDGMKEYKTDCKKKDRDTEYYCSYQGKSLEELLRK